MSRGGFEMEQFLARRLKDHGGAHVEDGVTDIELRMARFREIIRSAGLEQAIIGRRPGASTPETYAQFFQRCYGEML